MTTLVRSSVLLFSVIAGTPVRGQLQCAEELLAPNLSVWSYAAGFGASLSRDGDRVVIGAPVAPGAGSTPSGAAYLFERTPTGWVETDRVVPLDGALGDRFGVAVSLNGDRALIGSVSNDDNGSAYVFELIGGTWVETSKLRASDGAPADEFGAAVALSADTAFVASLTDDDETGAVYVFEHTGSSWLETAKLVASDAAPGAFFGQSIALDGDTVLIGAPFAATALPGTLGAVYVFERTPGGWTETDKLFMTTSWSGYFFGVSVALDGQTALIGADYGLHGTSFTGAAYLFVKGVSGWTLTDTLFASDGVAQERFGASVSLDGDTAAIGAELDENSLGRTGAAYVFERGPAGWNETVKLLPLDPTPLAWFGGAVSIEGGTVMVGSPDHFHHHTVSQTGSAYVFDLPCGGSYCTPAIPNSTGVPGVIGTSGSSVVAANDFSLTADQLPPGQFGYFLVSSTQGFFNPPASNGLICLGGSIGRYNRPEDIIVGPTGTIQVDLNAVPQAGGFVAVQPGDTFNFQAWYRDVAGTNNFTDAIEILFL